MNRNFAVFATVFGACAIYAALTPPATVSEQETDGAGLMIEDSPENVKVYGEQFESGADVDFDLSAYFEDLFNRVSAYTEREIGQFLSLDVWGQ